MKTVTIHDQAYEYYPWEVLGDDILKLGYDIIQKKLEFDRIIALAKGGLTFSRSLTDLLAVNKLSSIQIEFYTDIDERAKTPVITQSLPVTIRNERILIFDDIVDHGDTMDMAVTYLKYHGATSITTSCLIEKPWSSFKSDFTARKTEAWVIFPNETRETIELLTKNWQKLGDNDDKIRDQLLNIGFDKREVALFGPEK